MRRLTWLSSWAAVAGFALVAACGSNKDGSSVEGGTAAAASNTSGTSFELGGGGSSSGKSGSSAGGSSASGSGATGNTLAVGGDDGSGDTGVGGESCASATQETELSPVYLVFLLDESGSMGDGQHGDRTKKWDPVTSALKAFFADPESSGITASLSMFPLDKTPPGPADESIQADCDADVYSTPIVSPSALPDDKSFAAAMTAVEPPNEFGTPTLPALTGTIDYAESLLAEDKSRKVAIVMVTDGDPVSCDGNTISATAAAAQAVADHIPTYVIGVGESLTSLDAIAKGGGTDKAFIVSLTKPEQTRTDLLDAIELIRGQAISCELDIPAPPPGKKLDPDKVNVHYSGETQDDTSLKYGIDCTGDTAWHYDDATKPTKILLCDDTCATVKADTKAKLGVEFACVNRVVVQ
ncbi:MAG TPA: vWA domain-containing protein [Polyangiaceae bacterium]|nr:vWA domain-containing protein [Polyangiaceae bacterium]